MTPAAVVGTGVIALQFISILVITIVFSITSSLLSVGAALAARRFETRAL